jgi:spore coat polysaccharide biosynthesis protein SpsF
MIAIIIQARMGSTRLPKKVLADIEGHPMLWHVIERAKNAKKADKVIVATTDLPEDKEIIKIAESCGVESYAGSENDVLDRYYMASKKIDADIIVRITGDCPFIDPEIIDKTIEYFKQNEFDYVSIGHIASNNRASNYPDGLDTEVFSFSALEKAHKEAKMFSEKEHVTPYIWKNPQIFKIATLDSNKDYSQMRWTVDEERDLKFVKEVYKKLYPTKKIFLMQDILSLLQKNPEIENINNTIFRDEGYTKSLNEDEKN